MKIYSNKDWDGLSLGQLKKEAKLFYSQNLKGTTVVNKQKGIKIKFTAEGIKHLLHARNSGYIKIKAVSALKSLVENASYSNFKNPDADDSFNIVGYFNFTSRVIIEGQTRIIHLTVRLTKDGKFYYEHSYKVKK